MRRQPKAIFKILFLQFYFLVIGVFLNCDEKGVLASIRSLGGIFVVQSRRMIFSVFDS